MAEWTPQNDQLALTLAAIRWYTISIEKLATDLYVTNKELYPKVQDQLNTCFRELGKMRKHLSAEYMKAARTAAAETATDQQQPQKLMMTSGRCGPGYVYCHGVCLPDCDDMEAY